MKILYGIQGTGNGHISRSRKMATQLRARGADVTYLVSGRARDYLFDMDVFGSFVHRDGLTLVQKSGSVCYRATLAQTHPTQFIRDVRALDVDAYDLVISDFEPITAWAARLRRKVCMGIGHQYAFQQAIPKISNTLTSDLVMRWFAPVDIPIGLHWHHFNRDILPPIIDTSLAQDDSAPLHILVYLPFEQQQTITALLQRFEHYHFVQYAPDLVDSEAGNVSLRRTNLHGFRADLCRAAAVICNAGFELVGECLHMGIPTLVKPVHGQMEQQSNAFALTQLGWGSALQQLDEQSLRDWLDGERWVAPIAYPDVAAELTDWILAGDWQNKMSLWNTLWDNTRMRKNKNSEKTARQKNSRPHHYATI